MLTDEVRLLYHHERLSNSGLRLIKEVEETPLTVIELLLSFISGLTQSKRSS